MDKTLEEYNGALNVCRELFLQKVSDYGTSWRVLRISSLTDQLFIKAQRIRNLEMGKENKVDEGVEPEFIGLVNYGIIGLIQIELGTSDEDELSFEDAVSQYDKQAGIARDLMMAKNHDYGEAWRQMRISSLTDLILVKLKRIKQIEDNAGQTLVSEGIDANYLDIINYALFALIRLDVGKKE
jgi:hypothetical protein